MMVYSFLLVILSLFGMWFGAESVVKNVSLLSRRFRVSEFWVSFFVLGFAMSGPELAIGINSIVFNLPEVLVGDKIGSSIGIFLLIIPTLAIVGNGVELKQGVREVKLLLSFFLILLPAMLLVDGDFSKIDSLICLIVYIFLSIYFGLTAKKETVTKSIEDALAVRKSTLAKEFFGILLGSAVIYLMGNVMITNFKIIMDNFKQSYFAVSLFLMSLGTSMPELVVLIKSVVKGKKEVTFGGYLGSAVANSMILAVLGLFYGDIVIGKDVYFMWLYGLFLLGIILFYWFIKSKQVLSRSEGIILIMFYLSLIAVTARFN